MSVRWNARLSRFFGPQFSRTEYVLHRPAHLEKAAHMTAALPPIAKIAELLGGDVQGAEVLCPGPGHSAGDRSLSVKPDPADREGFVTHSFAGDDWKDCRDHVRKELGLPEPKSEPPQKTNGGKAAWTVLAEYVYLDQNGERFLKVRKCRDETGKKQFPQYHWDGNGWAKGKPQGSRIPYRLPQLIATPITAQVYFCEGEKDADTLANIGFVATTASEGAAAKWDSGLTLFFKDRHVVICRTLIVLVARMRKRSPKRSMASPPRCGSLISFLIGMTGPTSRIPSQRTLPASGWRRR
jgi:hypothetical protein